MNPMPLMRLPVTLPALLAALCLLAGACASRTQPTLTLHDPTLVEAACGECLFGMKGDGCDLAIRIHGRAWYVDGVNLDSLGDAHAADGMCQMIRKAHVTGEVVGGRFHAREFTLLPK